MDIQSVLKVVAERFGFGIEAVKSEVDKVLAVVEPDLAADLRDDILPIIEKAWADVQKLVEDAVKAAEVNAQSPSAPVPPTPPAAS